MGKIVISLLILFLLFFVDFSKASLFFNSRKLSENSTNGVTNNTTVSPISNPVSIDKQANPVADNHETKEKQDIKPTPAATSGEDKSKDKKVENNKGLTPPTHAKEEDKTPKEQVKEKSQSKSDSPPKGSESCDGVEKSCRDSKSMIACIKSFDNEALSKAMVLIQNGGDVSLKVDVKTSLDNKPTVVDVAKHQNKKVNISLANGGSNVITLNAGHGDCVLQIGVLASQGYYPEWLPSYSKFMTPMYGAYFLLAMTILAGMIFACCWFGRKGKSSDIPYQELEMSMPETAVTVETAEGWDQVWDDDWDEEKAVKSPGGRNISANGLTSRSSKRNDWEDWDD